MVGETFLLVEFPWRFAFPPLLVQFDCSREKVFPLVLCDRWEVFPVVLEQCVAIRWRTEDDVPLAARLDERCRSAIVFAGGQLVAFFHLLIAAVCDMVAARLAALDDQFVEQFLRQRLRPFSEQLASVVEVDDFKIA